MKFFLILIIFLIATSHLFSQIRFDAPISKTDSVSIGLFWNAYRTSIQQKDKRKLARLFKFPFYCPQCLDYDRAGDPFKVTMNVSRTIFIDSIFKLFFDIPTLTEFNKKIWSGTIVFYKIPATMNVKPGWKFSYAIIAPSKKSEGIQGFIYIRKRKGKYKIDGLDTVP